MKKIVALFLAVIMLLSSAALAEGHDRRNLSGFRAKGITAASF